MILISKDSKGKVRVVEINYTLDNNVYTISRNTGLFRGKMVEQPEITITKGKAKRTIKEQVELEFNSHVKKYLDKGYKKYDDLTKISFDTINAEEISELLSNNKTDTTGMIKPMLAKDHNKCKSSIFDKDWYVSRKIDGVRCLMYWDEKSQTVRTGSRGGGDYDGSTQHITSDENLIKFLSDNPSIILDGELYHHGYTLQQLSGMARKSDDEERSAPLEYWIYDYYDGNVAEELFEFRCTTLYTVALANFGINIDKDFNPNEDCVIRFVPHIKKNGFLEIDNAHNRYVEEGFEGLVARDPDKAYGVGKRDDRMFKYKKYQEDEFEITGMEEGLRDEDMVFTCVTKAGGVFKAKPIGSREIKDRYRNDIESLIGKMATVKFFYYSEDDIPLQPVLKTIRDYD